LKIVEDFSDFDATFVDDKNLKLDDTLDLLNTYVDEVDTTADKQRIKTDMKRLYVEASNNVV
jgi:ribosomal protein L23